jgi:hypothetical protein
MEYSARDPQNCERGLMLNVFLCLLTTNVVALVTNSQRGEANSMFAVTARPRTTLIQAGRHQWYELTIKNETKSDQIIDLGSMTLTSADFLGPQGIKSSVGRVSTDVNVATPKCADWTAFALIRPGESLTTLAKIETPLGLQGTMELYIDLDLWYVAELANCREERAEANVKVQVHIQAP